MTSQLNSRLLSSYRLASRVAGGIVLAVGFLVLLGWLLDIPAFKGLLPGLATMKANTALAFVLAGTSLWLAHGNRENQRLDRIARACATLTALIGLFTLSEYIFSQDLGIDQLLFKDVLTPENPHPGRMPPMAALNFFLLGLSLLLLDHQQYRRLVEAFSITALLISVLAFLGYAYGVSSLYHFFPYSSLAIHTTLAFLILCLGILFARPEQGLMKVFSRDNSGSVMARRLMPAALALPFLLGWLFLAGERMGLYDSTFRLVLFATSTVMIFAILIWWNASLLQSADVVIQQAEAQLGQSEEREAAILYASLDAVITMDHQGRVLEFNPAAQKIFGYHRDEVLGREMSQLIIPPALREQHRRGLAKYLATGEGPVLGKRLELTGMRADGTEFPVELTITPITGSEQPVFTGFVRDLTQRQQAEEQIAYQAYLLENVNDAVIGSDENSIIRFWNQGAERMFGWKAGEALGRSGREILRSEFINTGRETVSKILAEQGRWRGEAILYRKDGSQVIMEVSSITLRDANGVITGYVSVNRDIAERKQAEADLYKSEELLRLGYDTAKLGIWQNNLVTGMVHFDERARAQYGFDADNVSLADVIARVHPDDIDRLGQEIATTTDPASDGRYGTEYRVIHPDGSVHWLAVQAHVYFQGEGNSRHPVTGFGTSQDITERKLAEEELRKNAARTQALADISGTLAAVHLDFQAILDAAARHTTELIGDACSIRLVSDDGQWLELASLYHPEPKTLAFLREILGTNPLRTDTGSVAQIIQTGHPMLIPVISPEQLKAIIPATTWSILEHISIHSLLTVPLRAQGVVLGTLTLTRDQPDQPYTSEDEAFLQDLADRAALSIANARLYTATQQLNDNLEQRVVERTAALSQANSLLQMMLDNMPDQIYFKDAQSRFIRNSRSQARALGLSDPAEAVGKSDFDFFPHAQLSFEKEQEIIRSGKPLVDVEERVVWPDGRETWVSTTKVPLPDQTGQIIGTFGISRDITDRKQAEVALQKAKLELEAANRELEAFSYSVSHDLRAPLRSIDGFSQALLEDYSELLPAEGRNFLERVRSSAQHMAELIDDLLNLSKVTRASMKLVSVDLSQLVQGIAAELQRTHAERRLSFNITPNLKAYADPNLLQIVLENLLNNAWKFTSKREQAQIEFGSKHENAETIYFVRDNGAGFDMAYANKLFGAFQRLHTMTEFPGTGIGLATVQRIINRHGGRIWAEGAVGQGATFFFTLPALERAKPKAEPKEKDSLTQRVKEII